VLRAAVSTGSNTGSAQDWSKVEVLRKAKKQLLLIFTVENEIFVCVYFLITESEMGESI
jgi:hypothetical protein